MKSKTFKGKWGAQVIIEMRMFWLVDDGVIFCYKICEYSMSAKFQKGCLILSNVCEEVINAIVENQIVKSMKDAN